MMSRSRNALLGVVAWSSLGGLLTPISATAEPLRLPLAVYAAGAAADLATTHHFLQYTGLREGNPLGGWLSDRPTALVVSGAALDATTVWVLHRVWGRRHPRAERVALYAAGAARIGLAVRNYRATAGLGRRAP